MSKNTWDAVLASVPLNRVAGSVTSKGTSYEPDLQFCEINWENCPPFAAHPRAGNFVDLTGQRFGRFTVVGYVGKLNPKKKAVWACRCVCGRYEGRHAPAIVAAYADAKCRFCKHTATLQLQASSDNARDRASSPSAPLNTFIREREQGAA